MRLLVKQNGRNINECQFNQGPISIGRQRSSQLCLPDKAVSKKHAVIFAAEDGKWMVEDMDSTNKTYLNDKEIKKAEIKSGDILRIKDFTIEVVLENDTENEGSSKADDTLELQATLATPPHEIIVRKADAGHAPAMRLAAGRLTDFAQATEAICDAENLEELLQILVKITLKQFEAFHTWCALREQANGPMNYQAGKRRDGKVVELSELELSDKINQAVERGQSLVLPRVAAQIQAVQRIRSAMIAAIMRPGGGCFGVLYVDNAMVHEHYSLSDLDYLMLVAIHTAAVLKKFLNI